MLLVALKTFIVFIAALLIDVFYVLWMRFASKGWEHRAAAMSMFVGAMGLLGAWMVIAESKWYAIPDLIGLYLGTILGIRLSKRLERSWRVGEAEAANKVRGS